MGRYDLIILGGGSAGIVAGVVAGTAGLRTLLIEKRRMGGECLNTGCVPSKALLHAAHVAHQLRAADQLGLRAVPVTRADAAGVMRHVRATVTAVEKADPTTDLLRGAGVEIRFGDAAFESPGTLQFAERDGRRQHLTAEHFLLATGSSPARPAIPGLAETGYLTNEELFDLDEIPESLLVVGGGPIGVEMAQAFQRLGSAVTLVGRASRLLPRDDPEAAAVLQGVLRQEGIDVRLGAEVIAIHTRAGQKIVQVQGDGRAEEVAACELLVAVGRRPNVAGLNLEAAGVHSDHRGVQVSPTLHTTGLRVWACGDVTGRHQFSHMAEYEARLVIRNLLFPLQATALPGFELDPWTTFTDPEVARVGLTEDAARSRSVRCEVYRQPFAQNDRALTENAAVGFVKVLAAGWQGRILGAHVVGPRAGELIQEWIQAMTAGLTLRQVADTIHVYPTLSMANQHAASRWYEAQATKPLVRRALSTYTHAVRPNLGRILWTTASAAVLAGAWLWARQRKE
jgi:pyruvate/2-oxoglutarate dehydrogenase complex dihydrolipoamide dehydrogenase (E3) component